MVVEDIILRQVTFWAFVGCNNPITYLVLPQLVLIDMHVMNVYWVC